MVSSTVCADALIATLLQIRQQPKLPHRVQYHLDGWTKY